MPIRDAVVVQPLVGAVVSEIVKQAPPHATGLGVCVDISQGMESPSDVMVWETRVGNTALGFHFMVPRRPEVELFGRGSPQVACGRFFYLPGVC